MTNTELNYSFMLDMSTWCVATGSYFAARHVSDISVDAPAAGWAAARPRQCIPAAGFEGEWYDHSLKRKAEYLAELQIAHVIARVASCLPISRNYEPCP
jgi:hypothetical protein